MNSSEPPVSSSTEAEIPIFSSGVWDLDLALRETQLDKSVDVWEDRGRELAEYSALPQEEINRLASQDTKAAVVRCFAQAQGDGDDPLAPYRSCWFELAVRMMTAYERVSRCAVFLRQLCERIQPSDRADCVILDYGCGVADCGLVLALAGFRVRIVEVEGGLLELARWRFARRGLPVESCPVTPDDIHPEPGPAGAALLTDVLEHVAEPLRVLQGVVNGLCSPGLIFVSHDNFRLPRGDRPGHVQGHLECARREMCSLAARRFLARELIREAPGLYRRHQRRCPSCGSQVSTPAQVVSLSIFSLAERVALFLGLGKSGLVAETFHTLRGSRLLVPDWYRCPRCVSRWTPR